MRKHPIIFLLIFSICSRFFAQTDAFKLDFKKDAILLGTGFALTGSDLILDDLLEVGRDEYSGQVYDKSDVNSFDRFFMHGYSSSMHTVSTISLVSLMVSPAILLPLSDRPFWPTEIVMYSEVLLIANGIKELTKLCVDRTRPYMYYDISDAPEDKIDEGDFVNSFMSGHSTMAFASASFLTYTYWKLFPESSLKIPVAAGSFAVAALTAVLRVMGGNHFASDVLVGAAVGTSVGFLVPFLHTFGSGHDNFQVSPSASGVSFKINF